MNRPTALVDVEDVRAHVDAVLALRVAELRGELARSGREADRLADAVEVMLSGGKRLRAAFCYWSWRAHGGLPGTAREQVVLEVGAALELFQAAALFHDDVMDDSDTRRGLPAAHRTFADLHVSAAWSGDARRFGESAAGGFAGTLGTDLLDFVDLVGHHGGDGAVAGGGQHHEQQTWQHHDGQLAQDV